MSNSLSLLFNMNNHERIGPVALYKRANVSDSLPSLMTKEQWERFALFHDQIALSLTKNELFARKTSERISNPDNPRTVWPRVI